MAAKPGMHVAVDDAGEAEGVAASGAVPAASAKQSPAAGLGRSGSFAVACARQGAAPEWTCILAEPASVVKRSAHQVPMWRERHFVMRGLDPRISIVRHGLAMLIEMAGTSPAMTNGRGRTDESAIQRKNHLDTIVIMW